MDKNNIEKYKVQANILKALAHPTRLFIINELANKELCVNEITAMVGVDASTISNHLSLLKNAGVVQDEKRGKSVFYSLKAHCVLNFFNCIQQFQVSKRNDV